MLRRLILIVLPMLLLTGCSQLVIPDNPPNPHLEDHTSGLIGCPSDEILITDSNYKPGAKIFNAAGTTWTAECRGKVFYCSWPMGQGPRCTEDLKTKR